MSSFGPATFEAVRVHDTVPGEDFNLNLVRIYNAALWCLCYGWGTAAPYSANHLWYLAQNVTLNGHSGWVNDHFPNTPGYRGQPSAGDWAVLKWSPVRNGPSTGIAERSDRTRAGVLNVLRFGLAGAGRSGTVDELAVLPAPIFNPFWVGGPERPTPLPRRWRRCEC